MRSNGISTFRGNAENIGNAAFTKAAKPTFDLLFQEDDYPTRPTSQMSNPSATSSNFMMASSRQTPTPTPTQPVNSKPPPLGLKDTNNTRSDAPLRDNPPVKKTLISITIELDDDHSDDIKVYENSTAHSTRLAAAFCEKNNLPESSITFLVQQINEQLNVYNLKLAQREAESRISVMSGKSVPETKNLDSSATTPRGSSALGFNKARYGPSTTINPIEYQQHYAPVICPEIVPQSMKPLITTSRTPTSQTISSQRERLQEIEVTTRAMPSLGIPQTTRERDRSTGRSDSTLRFYNEGVRWLKSKEEHLEKKRKEREEAEREKYSFKPKISRAPSRNRLTGFEEAEMQWNQNLTKSGSKRDLKQSIMPSYHHERKETKKEVLTPRGDLAHSQALLKQSMEIAPPVQSKTTPKSILKKKVVFTAEVNENNQVPPAATHKPQEAPLQGIRLSNGMPAFPPSEDDPMVYLNCVFNSLDNDHDGVISAQCIDFRCLNIRTLEILTDTFAQLEDNNVVITREKFVTLLQDKDKFEELVDAARENWSWNEALRIANRAPPPTQLTNSQVLNVPSNASPTRQKPNTRQQEESRQNKPAVNQNQKVQDLGTVKGTELKIRNIRMVDK